MSHVSLVVPFSIAFFVFISCYSFWGRYCLFVTQRTGIGLIYFLRIYSRRNKEQKLEEKKKPNTHTKTHSHNHDTERWIKMK